MKKKSRFLKSLYFGFPSACSLAVVCVHNMYFVWFYCCRRSFAIEFPIVVDICLQNISSNDHLILWTFFCYSFLVSALIKYLAIRYPQVLLRAFFIRSLGLGVWVYFDFLFDFWAWVIYLCRCQKAFERIENECTIHRQAIQFHCTFTYWRWRRRRQWWWRRKTHKTHFFFSVYDLDFLLDWVPKTKSIFFAIFLFYEFLFFFDLVVQSELKKFSCSTWSRMKNEKKP